MKRLIIHIGQHKTGSKALQAYLAHNRTVLRRHGILYPPGSPGAPAYEISHHIFYQSLRNGTLWLETLDQAPLTIVSAEDIFDMATAHTLQYSPQAIHQAAQALQPHRPQIVVYLRDPAELLVAHYGQFIKGSPTNHLSFEEFSAAFAPRLDSQSILAIWKSYFPDLIQRPYSKDIVTDFFEHVLAMQTPPDCQPAPPHPEYVNRSVDRDAIELIRLMNRYGIRRPSRDAILAAARPSRGPSEYGPGYPGLRPWPALRILLKALLISEKAAGSRHP